MGGVLIDLTRSRPSRYKSFSVGTWVWRPRSRSLVQQKRYRGCNLFALTRSRPFSYKFCVGTWVWRPRSQSFVLNFNIGLTRLVTLDKFAFLRGTGFGLFSETVCSKASLWAFVRDSVTFLLNIQPAMCIFRYIVCFPVLSESASFCFMY